jgi:hypothetical protein
MADETNTTPTPTVAPATPTPASTGEVAQVTVVDLLQVVKLLENLAQMKRLSDLEVAGIKPAFDKIVAFLAYYEAQMQAQQANTVAEISSDEIDVTEPVTAKKKKSGKGKK